MNKLEELGLKYGTDKGTKHNYLKVYYDLFHNNGKRKKVKKVLEIGVAEGAGLFMFRDFFTNATIYGAEIDQARVDKLQGKDRIEVYKCDQSKSEDLVSLFVKIRLDIDLIIDDGSHKPEDQVFTCLSILPSLNKGAIYIIEDVADLSIVKEIEKFYKPEVVRVGERYDDVLVIIRT